jgi:hypothetical protein
VLVLFCQVYCSTWQLLVAASSCLLMAALASQPAWVANQAV